MNEMKSGFSITYYNSRFYLAEEHCFYGGGAVVGECLFVIDVTATDVLESAVNNLLQRPLHWVDSHDEIPKPTHPIYKAAGFKSWRAHDMTTARIGLSVFDKHTIISFDSVIHDPRKDNPETRRLESVCPRDIAQWLVRHIPEFEGHVLPYCLTVRRERSSSAPRDPAIPMNEWEAYIKSDPSLEPLNPNNVLTAWWLGGSDVETPGLDYGFDTIATKSCSKALIYKMIEIAKALGCTVQGPGGRLYQSEEDVPG